MKLWQSLLLVLGVFILLLFFPENIAKKIGSLLVSASAVWVYVDSKKLNAREYKSSFFAMSPGGLFVGTLLLWIFFFPGYLSLRYKITHNLIQKKVPTVKT